MARIRTIKPDFWTDEKVIELSPWARLLFIGLWNFCDDAGRMPYSPKRIKLQVFPAETFDISEVFGELRGKGMVTVYSHENQEYLQVSNFGRHQKIDHRTSSKYPAPPIPPESHRIPPLEGKGREGNGMDKRQVAALPDWLDKAAWNEWETHRREIRKTLTPKTIKAQLKMLETHKQNHVEIIEQSIQNGWTGLFALKATADSKPSRNLSAVDRVMAANAKQN